MGIEKLIERFEYDAKDWAGDPHIKKDLTEAATALSTLQAENAQLRGELEYEQEHANAYYEECGQWEAENAQLKAKLEAFRREVRDENQT